MSSVTRLHDAVKRGDIETITSLLGDDRGLANAVSETDPRLTYPLHVAAEFDRANAARILLDYGADVSLLDVENDASPSAGRRSSADPAGRGPARGRRRAEPAQQARPHAARLRGARDAGEWATLSDATVEDWRRAAEMISAAGGKA